MYTKKEGKQSKISSRIIVENVKSIHGFLRRVRAEVYRCHVVSAIRDYFPRPRPPLFTIIRVVSTERIRVTKFERMSRTRVLFIRIRAFSAQVECVRRSYQLCSSRSHLQII